MASINVSEEDFGHVFAAAHRALDTGDFDGARALDKIARKINASLSHDNSCAKLARMMGARGKQASWKDQPSVFEHRNLPTGFANQQGGKET